MLVDFWATWCGPCKLISKVVEKAADEYPADKLKIVKIEVDPNPELVEKYEVYGLPTIVLFKDGEVVESIQLSASKRLYTVGRQAGASGSAPRVSKWW